jgi:hypothetical protein
VRSFKPATSSTSGSKRKNLIESEDEEDFKPLAKKPNTAASRPSVTNRQPTAMSSAAPKKNTAATKKPVRHVDEYEDEDGDEDEDDEEEYEEEEEDFLQPKVTSRKAPVRPAKKNAVASGSTVKKAVVKDEPKPATSAPKYE